MIIAVVALAPWPSLFPGWQLCAAGESCNTGSPARCGAPTSTKSGFINEPEFLTAPESSTLRDYGQSYEKLEQLRPFPADRGALIALAVSLVVPMLPVILSVIPLAVMLNRLLEPPLAARAATHASADENSEMEDILQRQDAKLAQGAAAVAEDEEFH